MSRASRSHSHTLTLDYPYHDLTGAIIGAGYAVHNAKGFGFLERVYRRALVVELAHLGISSEQEVSFPLHHRGVPIGLYKADLIVESRVVVEVKTGFLLDPAVVPQTLNYLKASGLSVGLVLYFGPSLKVKRVTKFSTPPEHQGSGEPDDHR
jgi:GxxExxY protein